MSEIKLFVHFIHRGKELLWEIQLNKYFPDKLTVTEFNKLTYFSIISTIKLNNNNKKTTNWPQKETNQI